MERVDDPKLSGPIVLFRRIPPYPDKTQWGEDGIPTFSSANFKDREHELSLNIATETSPDAVLAGHKGFGLVQITVDDIRQICGEDIKICRDLEEPENGHVLVCGKVSGGKAKQLQRKATWVDGRWPLRNPPEFPAAAQAQV